MVKWIVVLCTRREASNHLAVAMSVTPSSLAWLFSSFPPSCLAWLFSSFQIVSTTWKSILGRAIMAFESRHM